jgi:hypothetical protein
MAPSAQFSKCERLPKNIAPNHLPPPWAPWAAAHTASTLCHPLAADPRASTAGPSRRRRRRTSSTGWPATGCTGLLMTPAPPRAPRRVSAGWLPARCPRAPCCESAGHPSVLAAPSMIIRSDRTNPPTHEDFPAAHHIAWRKGLA